MHDDRRPTAGSDGRWSIAATPAFQDGLALFNAGQFWEAHEAWETPWRTATEPERTWLQGHIQLAAALVHWQRGNRRGLAANWAKARPKLVAIRSLNAPDQLWAVIATTDALVLGQTHEPPQLG